MQLQVDDNKGRHLSSKAVANRAETGNRRAEEFPHTDRALLGERNDFGLGLVRVRILKGVSQWRKWELPSQSVALSPSSPARIAQSCGPVMRNLF